MMRFLDWAFRSRETGRLVVGQAPNLALWLFAAAWGVAWLAGPDGAVAQAARIAADVLLALWAADEILRGVNPWRRLLGLAVLGTLAGAALR